MALCTIDKTDESFAIQRLEKSGLEYEICPINAHRLNLFFGKKECIDIVRLICNRPLKKILSWVPCWDMMCVSNANVITIVKL